MTVTPSPSTLRWAATRQRRRFVVAVLGASNYTHSEATGTQGLAYWICAHMRAFEFLRDVPEIVVPDNLKSRVTKACRYEPSVNRTYAEMAAHYGVAVVPARPAKPRDSGQTSVGRGTTYGTATTPIAPVATFVLPLKYFTR